MNRQPTITSAAALIADPARAAMLLMLVKGRARPVGELAYGAGVSTQIASSRLAKLLAGGLLCKRKAVTATTGSPGRMSPPCSSIWPSSALVTD